MDYARGVHKALQDRGIPEIDWYRQAQDRNSWRRRAVYGIRPEQADELKSLPKEDESRWTGGGRKDAYEARKKLQGQSRKPITGANAMKRNDGKYECPVCDKVSESAKGIMSHYSKMHGSEQILRNANGGTFTCETCGKECRSQAGLRKHMKTHEKD